MNSNKKNIYIYNGDFILSDAFDEAIAEIKSTGKYEIICTDDPEEIIQMAELNPCMIVFCGLHDKEHVVGVVSILTNLRLYVQENLVKVLAFDYIQHKKIEDRLQKHSIAGILSDKINVKALKYKIDLMTRTIDNSYRFYQNKLKSKNEVKKFVKNMDPFSVISFIKPLDTSYEIWSIESRKNFSYVARNNSWDIEITGPTGELGEWINIGRTKNNEDYWRWQFNKGSLHEEILEKGTWIFQGRKPEYITINEIWKFSAKNPMLYYFDEKPIFFKIKWTKKDISVAKDSMVVKKNLIQIQTFATMLIEDNYILDDTQKIASNGDNLSTYEKGNVTKTENLNTMSGTKNENNWDNINNTMRGSVEKKTDNTGELWGKTENGNLENGRLEGNIGEIDKHHYWMEGCIDGKKADPKKNDNTNSTKEVHENDDPDHDPISKFREELQNSFLESTDSSNENIGNNWSGDVEENNLINSSITGSIKKDEEEKQEKKKQGFNFQNTNLKQKKEKKGFNFQNSNLKQKQKKDSSDKNPTLNQKNKNDDLVEQEVSGPEVSEIESLRESLLDELHGPLTGKLSNTNQDDDQNEDGLKFNNLSKMKQTEQDQKENESIDTTWETKNKSKDDLKQQNNYSGKLNRDKNGLENKVKSIQEWKNQVSNKKSSKEQLESNEKAELQITNEKTINKKKNKKNSPFKDQINNDWGGDGESADELNTYWGDSEHKFVPKDKEQNAWGRVEKSNKSPANRAKPEFMKMSSRPLTGLKGGGENADKIEQFWYDKSHKKAVQEKKYSKKKKEDRYDKFKPAKNELDDSKIEEIEINQEEIQEEDQVGMIKTADGRWVSEEELFSEIENDVDETPEENEELQKTLREEIADKELFDTQKDMLDQLEDESRAENPEITKKEEENAEEDNDLNSLYETKKKHKLAKKDQDENDLESQIYELEDINEVDNNEEEIDLGNLEDRIVKRKDEKKKKIDTDELVEANQIEEFDKPTRNTELPESVVQNIEMKLSIIKPPESNIISNDISFIDILNDIIILKDSADFVIDNEILEIIFGMNYLGHIYTHILKGILTDIISNTNTEKILYFKINAKEYKEELEQIQKMYEQRQIAIYKFMQHVRGC